MSVAKEIELRDKFENMGAQMVKEVASKSSDSAGDGTTTATVLAQAIVKQGAPKAVTSRHEPNGFERGIDLAVDKVLNDLKSKAKKLGSSSEIAQVGTISANGEEEIGKKISEAMDKVGRDGVITVEESKTRDTTLETTEGMQFDRGYLSPYFITDAEKMICEFEDPYILLNEGKLSNLQDLLPLLEAYCKIRQASFDNSRRC